MREKRIVVVGGGFGGVAAARTARALLDSEHQVTLVDRARRTFLCGAFPLLIVGERETAKVSRSLGSLANRGVRYLQAEVHSIDVGSKTVSTSTGKLDYDYLVLAPGAVYDWDAVPGASDAYSFYDLQGARRLRRRLSSFRKGRIAIAVSSLPYKCPPAPFEVAMILDWAFKIRGVRRDVELHVFTPEPAPLPVAGPEARRSAAERHDPAGHTASCQRRRHRGGPQRSAGRFQRRLHHRLRACYYYTQAPDAFGSRLSGASGRLGAGSGCRPRRWRRESRASTPSGDVNMVPMANGRGLPKAGVFASAQGETVGRNIAAAINGSEPTIFAGVGHCFIAYGRLAGGHGPGRVPGRGQTEREVTAGYGERVSGQGAFRAQLAAVQYLARC